MAGEITEISPMYEDSLEVCLMKLHGSKGFALDVGRCLTNLAYIQETPDELLFEKENPYEINYKIRLLTFETSRLDDALHFIQENITSDADPGYPKYLSIGLGSEIDSHRRRIEEALGFELEVVEKTNSLARGILYGIKRFGKAFIRDLVYCPPKDSAHQNLEEYKELVANYKAVRDAEAEDEVPGPEDLELEEALNEKRMKEFFPCLLVSMDSAVNFTLVQGDFEDTEMVPATFHGSNHGGLDFITRGKHLTSAQSYTELMSFARAGCFDESSLEDPEKITTRMFEKALQSKKRDDVARTLLETICSDAVTQSVGMARQKRVKSVFFHGNFCRENGGLQKRIQELPYSDMGNVGASLTGGIVRYEGYLEVIGALMGKVDMMSLLMICPGDQ